MYSSARAVAGALLGATLFASAAHAQAKSTLDVDGRRLRPGVDSLAVYLIQGNDTIPTGLIRDELSITAGQTGPLLIRVHSTLDRVLGSSVDTVTDQLHTLAPTHQRSRSDRKVEFLTFSPTRVSGWVRLPNGDSVDVNAALPTPVYNATSFDLVLRASALSLGWNAEVPVFLSDAGTVVSLKASVDGVEQVDGELCWRVRANFVGLPVTFWVDQKTRHLRQQVMQTRPDTKILFRVPRPGPGPARPNAA